MKFPQMLFENSKPLITINCLNLKVKTIEKAFNPHRGKLVSQQHTHSKSKAPWPFPPGLSPLAIHSMVK